MPKTATSSRDADKFVIRLPDGLRENVKQAAADNQRSMNNEIIARIIAGGQPNQVVNTWTPQVGMAVLVKERQPDVIVELEVFNNQVWAILSKDRRQRYAVQDLKPFQLTY